PRCAPSSRRTVARKHSCASSAEPVPMTAGPASAGPPAAAPVSSALADSIDALLPQTQCTKCGFDGCRPYAEAIAAGVAPINRCPPGGASGITRLARLLGRAVLELDPECGVEAPR